MTHGAVDVPTDGGGHSEDHPTERTYIMIAAVLTAITLIEVIIYYIDWMHDTGLLVPVLAVLSVIKFVTVVGVYMHLRYDDVRYRMIFGAGLFVAIGIISALVVLHATHRIAYAQKLFT